MNEITSFDPPSSMGSSLLTIIAKAATDPRVDIDKMSALLAMQERIVARDALEQFNAAMALVNQSELRVGKAGTASLGGKGSYRFARWEDMDEVIRPLLRNAGMWLVFDSKREADGGVTVSGTLSHVSGHSVTASLYLPLDTGPGRNPLQQVGSTLAYGKRYTAEMLLNIVREDEDTDGHVTARHSPSGAERSATRRDEPPASPSPSMPFVARAAAALGNEPNGTRWLALLTKILEACPTIDDLAQIKTVPSVLESSRNAPSAIRSIIQDNFTKAVDRLSPQEAPGHTDLMVTPESIHAFIEANPPDADVQAAADA